MRMKILVREGWAARVAKRLVAAIAIAAAGAASAGLGKGLDRAVDDLAVTPVGTPVVVDVVANDVALGDGRRLLNAHKGRNGKTSVVNGKVHYTPNAGFSGTDQFEYMVQPGAGGAPAVGTATVIVGSGSAVRVSIAGQVTDAPIANAQVVVSIGGYDFYAVADAEGRYIIDIASLQPDAFVSISATGTSPSGVPITFYSLVGEIARLAVDAGSDGVLVRDENNQVQVTNLSTAQFVLMTDANGGTAPDSDAELTQLTQNLNVAEVIELAAVMKLVVDCASFDLCDSIPPEYLTDPLALISDPAAVDVFADTYAAELDVATDAVIADPAITTGYTAATIPDEVMMIRPGAPGTIQVGILHGERGQFFRANAAATSGEVVVTEVAPLDSVDGQVVDWTLQSDGSIRFVPRGVESSNRVERLACGNDPAGPLFDWPVVVTHIDDVADPLSRSAAFDVLQVTERNEHRYSDPNPGDTCLPPPDREISTQFGMLWVHPMAGELPMTAAELSGIVALPVFSPETTPLPFAWTPALFDFSTSTMQHPAFQSGFTWSLLATGRVQVTVVDLAGTSRSFEYRRLQRDGRGGEGYFALTQGSVLPGTHYAASARRNGTLLFSPTVLTGTWISGFELSRPLVFGSPPVTFRIRYNADGTSFEAFDGAGGFPGSWRVDAPDSFVNERFVQPGSGQRHACAPGTLGVSCFLLRDRRWLPLSRDGNRIYVLEELRIRPPGTPLTTPPPLNSRRINFYELAP